MRQQNSLFNKACQFINSIPVGSTFTSKEYISAIGKHENSTWWKRINGNHHYNCHQYKGYLKKAGFLTRVSHGVWKVDRHIPDWFDFGHLSILLTYYKWDTTNRCNITTYKGMDRSDIIAQLDHDAHHPNGVKPNLLQEIPSFAGTTITQSFRYNTPANHDAFFGTHTNDSGKLTVRYNTLPNRDAFFGTHISNESVNSINELKKIEAELVSLTQRVQQLIKNLK